MDLIDYYKKNADDFSWDNLTGQGMLSRTRLWGETNSSEAFRRNLLLLDFQNQYNSPVAQMERLTAAGLSPFFAAQVLSGNQSASFSAEGDSNSSKQNSFNSVLNSIQQGLNFAGQLVGLVDSSLNTKINFNTAQQQINSSIYNNLLKSHDLKLKGANIDLLDFQRALTFAAQNEGNYSGFSQFGYPINITPEIYRQWTQAYQNYFGGELTKLKSEELEYKNEQILPLIKQKYDLSNQQAQYLFDVLDTIPADVRSYLMLFLLLKDSLIK